MQDRYFSELTFKEYKPTWSDLMGRPFRTRLSAAKRGLPSEVEIWDNGEWSVGVGMDRQTQSQVLRSFVRGLRSLGQEIGEPLSIWKRSLRFVTRDQIQPKTEGYKQALIKIYGETLANGGGGDCGVNDNGTFLLRVVDEGDSPSLIENRYSVAAHEYGHTLGEKFLDDPIFEELKAYSFEQLYMEHALRGIYDIQPAFTVNVHNIALFILEQLDVARIPLEATIAHLTQRSFGGFQPDDYKELSEA